jgi:hypothetical protein
MTTTEFKNEFLIHYNAIATNSAPGLDSYEISVFLTKAQLELVKNYYNPDGNKYKEGFENSEKRRTDLKELIKNFKSVNGFKSSEAISNLSKFFEIPEDVFLIVNERSVIKTDDCLDGSILNTIPKTHDEYNIQISNPFKNPDDSVVWRLDISKIGTKKVVELISNYDIKEYNLRYLKYPNPIIISDLSLEFPGEGLSIDGLTNITQCELHKSIHREVLYRAVELALRDYKPANLESKVQLDQRNE